MEVKAILGALKVVGTWVKDNPAITMGVIDTFAKIKTDKKAASIEEQFQIVDEKLNQVGAAALELEQKIDAEVVEIKNELEVLRKETHTLKKMLFIMGTVVGTLIIAVVLLAII